MNLKESFRYQSFLDGLIVDAAISIRSPYHCMEVTEIHHRSRAKAEALDEEKVVDSGEEYYKNDDVLSFLEYVLANKIFLCEAIAEAKRSLGYDVDAALEANKQRRNIADAIKEMLTIKPSTRTKKGEGYTFNLEGNQTTYYYDIEVITKENYNKALAKDLLKRISTHADEISTKIDKAMVDKEVNYTPVFDVNGTFEDAMEVFLSRPSASTN